ncbi:MAG TPA: hypothetical protein VKS25_05230, partial [Solirubrobacteraceae bacterium]|nr:hypothetical protein [Solirubrobacteraceae bacterium]
MSDDLALLIAVDDDVDLVARRETKRLLDELLWTDYDDSDDDVEDVAALTAVAGTKKVAAIGDNANSDEHTTTTTRTAANGRTHDSTDRHSRSYETSSTTNDRRITRLKKDDRCDDRGDRDDDEARDRDHDDPH